MERKAISVSTLRELLEKAWNKDTALGDWREDVPSLNQCAVTALVVQDFFGGDLLRADMTNGDSHYWNRLPNGEEVDLTEDQFQHIEAQPKKETFIIRSREYVLGYYPNTMRRYGVLLQRLAKAIEEWRSA